MDDLRDVVAGSTGVEGLEDSGLGDGADCGMLVEGVGGAAGRGD